MSFEILLTPRADLALERLPLFLREFVEGHLVRLGEAPHAVARSAVSSPYPPGDMVYEFDLIRGGNEWHHLSVFFRYGQDEATLYVVEIGHTDLDMRF